MAVRVKYKWKYFANRRRDVRAVVAYPLFIAALSWFECVCECVSDSVL